ncbi:flagellar protein FlaG [Paenibacillaceae bacterium GAS479]|nr:flagellar protein FlaG [Paenibacillaceae bacterium GAS479]
MNVELTLSASVSQAPVLQESGSLRFAQEKIGSVSSVKEMDQLQRQGVAVPPGSEQLIRNIDRAIRSMQGPETVLDISIHDKTHQLLVKVINKETGDLIREVPQERTLELVAHMMELAGIMIDKKV